MAITAKTGISFGIVGPLVFLFFYSIAMASDSEYTFFENYLSDLGVGPGAWAFNSGLVIVGVMTVLFALFGLGKILGTDIVSSAAKILLTICGALLAGVGVFNENYDPAHYVFSVSFFLTFFVALIMISISLYKSKALGSFGFTVSAMASVLGIALLRMGGSPESETLAVLTMLVWALLVSGMAMLKEYGHRIP